MLVVLTGCSHGYELFYNGNVLYLSGTLLYIKLTFPSQANCGTVLKQNANHNGYVPSPGDPPVCVVTHDLRCRFPLLLYFFKRIRDYYVGT